MLLPLHFFILLSLCSRTSQSQSCSISRMASSHTNVCAENGLACNPKSQTAPHKCPLSRSFRPRERASEQRARIPVSCVLPVVRIGCRDSILILYMPLSNRLCAVYPSSAFSPNTWLCDPDSVIGSLVRPQQPQEILRH